MSTFHSCLKYKGDTSGEEQWYHYFHMQSGEWVRQPIVHKCIDTPTPMGRRGKLATDKDNNLYALLPGNQSEVCYILQSRKEEYYRNWSVVWSGSNLDGEPLFDRYLLQERDVLSVIQRTSDVYPQRKIITLDFQLPAALQESI